MFLAAIVFLVAGQKMVSGDQPQQLVLSSASLNFSQRLYQRIATKEHNIVYSPYSIHSALSMTSLGARGVTETQMKETLGVTSLGDSLHTTYKELIQQYNSETAVPLNTGNALFINPQYDIVPEFLEDVEENYFAKAENFDMSAKGGPEKPINDYIADKTENMIREVLTPGSITSLTAMVLVNTIFFNGSWEKEFELIETRPQDFHQAGGAVLQMDMMNDVRWVNLKTDLVNRLDVAELPYKGGRFSMYIALPQQIDGITNLESLLAEPGEVEELFTDFCYNKYTHVTIPKFRIEYGIDLNRALEDMGIVDAFISGQANLTGITRKDGAYVSQVLHKAVIVVQESGTTASAASTVGIQSNSEPHYHFIADHEFIFFLRDKQTGQILFQGKFSG